MCICGKRGRKEDFPRSPQAAKGGGRKRICSQVRFWLPLKGISVSPLMEEQTRKYIASIYVKYFFVAKPHVFLSPISRMRPEHFSPSFFSFATTRGATKAQVFPPVCLARTGINCPHFSSPPFGRLTLANATFGGREGNKTVVPESPLTILKKKPIYFTK